MRRLTPSLLLTLAACASDAAPAPEPLLTTRGAFVAVDEGAGALTLYRTLDFLELDFTLLLFVTQYDAAPASFEEAREIAKGHDIPVRFEFAYKDADEVTVRPHQVVWFRTLTDEEEARVP